MRPHPPMSRLACISALAALLVLAFAPVARASVFGSDLVGGRPVSRDAALERSAPDVRMPAGCLVASDGQELWSREGDTERAMASTTKIMTAVITLEDADLDEVVSVPDNAARVGEMEVGLKAGDRMTIRKLLEALMVKSGNDAAVALAQRVGGTVTAFVKMMDMKASELDLAHTDFENPHGLDESGHHTSARDLAALARYAMRDPEFRRVVALRATTLRTKSGMKRLEASNRLLFDYPGANGIKTGWTDDAGYCVVGSAKRGGIELVAVVLGTESEAARFSQAERLLDWGFAHYRTMRLAQAGDSEGAVPVADYLDVTVPAVVAETTEMPLLDLDGEVKTELDIMPAVRAPVAAGDRLGTLTVSQGDRLLAQVPVVASADVAHPGVWTRMKVGTVRAWRRVFGGAMTAAPVPAP